MIEQEKPLGQPEDVMPDIHKQDVDEVAKRFSDAITISDPDGIIELFEQQKHTESIKLRIPLNGNDPSVIYQALRYGIKQFLTDLFPDEDKLMYHIEYIGEALSDVGKHSKPNKEVDCIFCQVDKQGDVEVHKILVDVVNPSDWDGSTSATKYGEEESKYHGNGGIMNAFKIALEEQGSKVEREVVICESAGALDDNVVKIPTATENKIEIIENQKKAA